MTLGLPSQFEPEIVEHVEPTALPKAKPFVRSCWLERGVMAPYLYFWWLRETADKAPFPRRLDQTKLLRLYLASLWSIYQKEGVCPCDDSPSYDRSHCIELGWHMAWNATSSVHSVQHWTITAWSPFEPRLHFPSSTPTKGWNILRFTQLRLHLRSDCLPLLEKTSCYGLRVF